MDSVLVIDDDLELCELLTKYLRREGFQVSVVQDGESGVQSAISGENSIIVLDVMLPGLNGFEALRQIRARSTTPILMLTARGDDVDRIVGLEMGADDYIAKPFNPRELVARIRAILRRSRMEPESQDAGLADRVVLGDIELSRSTRTVRRAGDAVALTAVEFDLLELLMRSAGKVVPRDELVKNVLGREPSPYDRAIDTHLSNLRKKLGTGDCVPERIKTIRGVGYILLLPEQTALSTGLDGGDS